MFLLDDLLIGGLGFVFDKIAAVVDQELNDEQGLHQTLLEAQMRLELGEIDDVQFAEIESAVIGRLRELRDEREGRAGAGAGEESLDMTDEGVRIRSIEISGPDDLDQ
jgi:hypothetical protein